MVQESFIPLSFERYEALVSYTRDSKLFLMGINAEVEGWSDRSEKVLGIICIDRIDNDFSVCALGRDEGKRYRAIDFAVSIPSIENARKQLFELMTQ